MISFTRHYVDRSNGNGFQFQFYCDRHSRDGLFGPTNRCSTIYTTDFETNPLGVASTLAQAASYVIGRGWGIGQAGHLVNSVYKNQAWQDAYGKAVDQCKKVFNQCSRCSAWVCKHNCWNEESQLCMSCAPHLATEAAAMKAQAAKVQVAFKAAETDHVKNVDLSEVKSAKCPHCNARSSEGKFCSSCGKEIAVKRFCPGCGTKLNLSADTKFCHGCGEKLG